MDTFPKYLYTTLEKAVLKLDLEGIYSIGLHIFCDDDDLRRPVVRMWVNTLAHARLHAPGNRGKRKGDAYDDLEAMWNDSYWIWKTQAAVGNDYVAFDGDYHDQVGIALRKAWIEALGLWYEDALEDDDFDAALEIGGKIVRQFDELCLQVAHNLHPVIWRKFGKDLPIIFFNRESPDHESIAMTFLANPTELIVGYAQFICKDCGEGWSNFFKLDIDKPKTSLSSLLDAFNQSSESK